MALPGRRKDHHSSAATSRSPRASDSLLFLAALLTSIFQFYVLPAVAGIHIPLFLLVVYALALRVNWMTAGRMGLGRLLIGIYVVQIISWSWSPNIFLGIRTLVYTFPFLIVFLHVSTQMRRNPQDVWRAIRIYCLAAAVQSSLVIVFRFHPSIESTFWSSPAAEVFITPNGLKEFLNPLTGNNAYDPLKAGGFMLNANVAGTWAGVLTFLTLACMRVKASPLLKIAFLIHIGAVFACGSKASLGLVFLVPAAAALFYGRPSNKVFQVTLGLFVCVLFLFAYVALPDSPSLFHGPYLEETTQTLLTRTVLWKHALHEFLRTPVLGHGFGGWELSLKGPAGSHVNVRDSFPPHNSLIDLWSKSGLPALALGLALIVTSVRRIHGLRETDPGVSYALLCAYLFFVLQELGENYGLLGEHHLSIAIASILGIASGLTKRPKRGVIH